MLVTKGRVRAGEDVLILGAGAGVGTAAIQIARFSGCRVWAAAGSEAKLRRAAELGAEVLINTSDVHFDDVVRERTQKRGVDVVVDYIGADTWVRSLRAVRRGGRILNCGATSGYAPETDLRHIFFRQLQIIGSTMGSMNDFHEVMALVFRGALEPVVGAILPLADARRAHEMIEARQAIGKIVLVG
jgi:NADPH:quinone reductase-like Zn-dependent oxidoreductase